MKLISLLRRALLLTAALALFLTIPGCGDGAAETKKEPSGEQKPLIGMSFDSFLIERWQRDRDVFVSTASELGAEVNVQIANGDPEEQISQIEYFIQKGVDAIVVVAVDCYGLAGIVKKAHDAGIYVIAYDRLVMNADVDLYISFDNEMVGTMMAEALVANLPSGGNILSIAGSPTDQNVAQAQQGFDAVIEQSSLHVVRQEYAPNWLAETAYNVVNKAIADGLTFDGVRCGNDDLASQAFLALSEHRLASDVKLVGQDADLAACQRIVEGTQLMTVYKPVEKLAKEAAEITVRMIRGEKIEASTTIFDETYNVPYEKLSPIMVTRDNIDEVIIDGGFHRREQVYLNMD
ncbi:MAG: sugar ABC transporter substrate-binding protein [Clostridiales bacterium]|nr:sugar ABC transporter substrate-binding protein [Clostridiales bacterium]